MTKTVIPWQGREVRVFHRTPVDVASVASWLDSEYWDEEDRERCSVLKVILENSPVSVEIDDSEVEDESQQPGDSADIYLRFSQEHRRILAFTLLAGRFVSAERFGEDVIVETFTTMVSNFEEVTEAAVLAALYEWMERNFRGAALPAFKVQKQSTAASELRVEAAVRKERREMGSALLKDLESLPEELEESAFQEVELDAA